jgi:hypothetical protein
LSKSMMVAGTAGNPCAALRGRTLTIWSCV